MYPRPVPTQAKAEGASEYRLRLEEHIGSILRDNKAPEERIAVISRYVSGERRWLEAAMEELDGHLKDLKTGETEANLRSKLSILSTAYDGVVRRQLEKFKDLISKTSNSAELPKGRR